VTGFFDAVEEKAKLFCEQCQRETAHSRFHKKAKFTCRDSQHVHPTLEEQERSAP
jgi:predicted HicB family RNase H-like nuclease